MKIIFDNNLSPHMARSLHVLMQHYADDGKSYVVTSVKEKFGTGDIPDVELLTALGQEGGWVFISGDSAIRRRPTELEAFKKAGLIGFFVSPALRCIPVTKQMAHLLELWTAIENLVRKAKPGAMYSLTKQKEINPL